MEVADEASCTVAESDTHYYHHCAPTAAAAAEAEEEAEKTSCQMHPETWVEFCREPIERRHLRLMNVEATASVAVAAAEAYDAALGLDPMGLLCIRRLSLLAATSLLFGHGGVGGTSLASQWR